MKSIFDLHSLTKVKKRYSTLSNLLKSLSTNKSLDIESLKKIYNYYSKKSPQPYLVRKKYDVDKIEKICEDILQNIYYVLYAYKPTKLNETLQWNENPFSDNSWLLQLLALTPVEQLTQGYLYFKNMKYLKKAKNLILDFIKKNPYNNSPSKYAWHDHGTAIRLMILLEFWEIWRKADDEDLNFMHKLLSFIHFHGQLLAKDDFYKRGHNHGIYQDESLILLSLILPEFDNSESWLEKAGLRLQEQIEMTFSSEGIHLENSPWYHYTMTLKIVSLQNLAKQYDISLTRETTGLIHHMISGIQYLLKPNNQFPLLGDTDEIFTIDDDLRKIMREYPELAYSVSQGKLGKRPKLVDHVFPESGYAIFRDRWHDPTTFDQTTYLLFKSGYKSRGHKHNDDLSFVLYGYGTDLLIDSGKYNYHEDDPYRQYFRSFAAHNTIMVDDKNPPFSTENYSKVKLLSNIQKDYVEVVGIHNLYPGIFIKRRLIFIKPNIVIIIDTATADNLHNYKQFFHFAPELSVNATHNHLIAGNKKAHLSLFWLEPVSLVKTYYGDTNPVQGWLSREHQQKEPHQVLELSKKGSFVRFKTLIYFDHEPATISNPKIILKKQEIDVSFLKNGREQNFTLQDLI